MSVLTISRQAGSRGTYIGHEVAKRLNYHYLEKAHIASMMRDYGFSKFDSIYDEIPTLWDRLDEYREMTIRFLVEMEMAIAQHGDVVIAGRGSFALLHDYRDVLNVRVKAPFEARVLRIMEEERTSEEDARAFVAQRDRVRKHFVESDFHFSYTDTTMFDIMLDTSVVPVDACIDLLVDAIQRGVERRNDARRSVHSIGVEPVLQQHVRKMLELFRDNPDYVLDQE